MEKNNQKLIRNIFKENNFAIGDSNFLAAEYISFLLNDVNINNIHVSFTSSYENHPEIKNIGNIAIADENNEVYSFSIKTNGVYNNVFDKSDVPFSIYFNKFDAYNNLILETAIYSGNQFENISSINITKDNEIINCTSNKECSWNTIYSKTDINIIDKELNIPIIETQINTNGLKLDTRLNDLFEQVNILTNSTNRTRK